DSACAACSAPSGWRLRTRPPRALPPSYRTQSATGGPLSILLLATIVFEPMQTFTIAVIPGDGVGTEVIPQGKRVLEKIALKHKVTFAFQDFNWGAEHYFRWGRMMPAGAIDLLQPCDAIFLGAVGHPEIPDHTTLNGLLLPIRRAFDQYANGRPAYLYP